MLKFHAHDTVNDIALIETPFKLNVRHGLQVKSFRLDNMAGALEEFHKCQQQALSSYKYNVKE